MFTQIREVCKKASQLPRRDFSYFSDLKDRGITKEVFIFLELGLFQKLFWSSFKELSQTKLITWVNIYSFMMRTKFGRHVAKKNPQTSQYISSKVLSEEYRKYLYKLSKNLQVKFISITRQLVILLCFHLYSSLIQYS